MVSRSDDIKFLDESKPIPSQSRFVDPNLHTSPKSNSFSNLNCECRWNGGILFALLPLAFYSHIMLTLTTSIGHPKFKITITITITRILEHIKTCHDPVCFRVETARHKLSKGVLLPFNTQQGYDEDCRYNIYSSCASPSSLSLTKSINSP